MSAVEEGAAYLFLSLLQARIGGSLVRRMADGGVRDVLQRPPAEISRQLRMTEKGALALAELRRGFDAGAVRDRLTRAGVAVLTMADEAYPGRLREIPDPPPALFVRGNLPEGPSVALVGSRKASSSGVDIARRLGLALAGRGVCIVSGLALGVDAAAHEGALDSPGRTVGVLGCGIDVAYPRERKPPRGEVPRLSGGREAGTAAGLGGRASSCVRVRRGRSRGKGCRPEKKPLELGGFPPAMLARCFEGESTRD